jgi:hypothetical protein
VSSISRVEPELFKKTFCSSQDEDESFIGLSGEAVFNFSVLFSVRFRSKTEAAALSYNDPGAAALAETNSLLAASVVLVEKLQFNTPAKTTLAHTANAKLVQATPQ